MDRIRGNGVPLAEHVGRTPYRGILTGFNEAFLIETSIRDRLIQDDPATSEFIKPFLRGQDIRRWSPEWDGIWLIALKSSGDYSWPWSDSDDPEERFRALHPGLYKHFARYRRPLERRQDRGRNWWELRACAYWDEFERPKLIYQEIQYHPRYAIDRRSSLSNNKTFFLPSDDLSLLGLLNSPLAWWFGWRFLPHMKDEALSPAAFLMEQFPIPPLDDRTSAEIEGVVSRQVEIADVVSEGRRDLLDWLGVELGATKPTKRLVQLGHLDRARFIAEVKKSLAKPASLSPAKLKRLREVYEETVEPIRALTSESSTLEIRLHDLSNHAYGLTPADVRLIWETAPPRMPTAAPAELADEAAEPS